LVPVIDHVFVLMLENRSYDHMLGWSDLRGTDAVSGEPTTAAGLAGTEWNELPTGGRVVATPGADYVLPIDPGHGFEDVLEQLCGPGATYPAAAGRYPPISNSGFVSRIAELIQKSGPHLDPGLVMRGFRPDQLPVLNTLAREFAVCDHWFSSMPGPTWPNRLFVHAASAAGLDDSPTTLRSATALFEGYRFDNGTIYDRLDSKEISWRVVEGDALPQALGLGGMIERAVQGRFITLDELAERLDDPKFPDSYVFIEPHYGHVLIDGSNFKCGNSQHPLDDVTRGDKLLKDVYELVRKSPHWNNSLLVVMYDEHGGFYDHVAPPEAVSPQDGFQPDNNKHAFTFDQLGVRVPALVISPYTARGLIDHTVYDHTSLLATLEQLWGLEPLTKRDGEAAKLGHLFGLAKPRDDTPVVLPAPAASGIRDCEDSLAHRLAGELEELPGELSGPLEATLVGFVQVAVARELHLAAAAHRDVTRAVDHERDRLLASYHGIRTKFDAVKYLHGVSKRYQEARQQRGGSP
jgi:phospholipase C